MIPMFKQKVGMTKIYAKGIAELFLIRCNPYHWDGSGEVPDNISFDVYKRKIDETYDGCTLEIQLCKPDGCLCYADSGQGTALAVSTRLRFATTLVLSMP
jgi:hypothetical protein